MDFSHSGELDGIWVTARSKRDLEVTSTRLLLQDGELTELEYGRHEWLTMRVVHRIFTECGDSSPRVECSRNAPEG